MSPQSRDRIPLLLPKLLLVVIFLQSNPIQSVPLQNERVQVEKLLELLQDSKERLGQEPIQDETYDGVPKITEDDVLNVMLGLDQHLNEPLIPEVKTMDPFQDLVLNPPSLTVFSTNSPNISVTTFKPIFNLTNESEPLSMPQIGQSPWNQTSSQETGRGITSFSIFHDVRDLGIAEARKREKCLCGVDILRPHSLLNHLHESTTNFSPIAASTQKPWTAVIVAKTWNQEMRRCEGSLINHHFVLSSVNCLCGESNRILSELCRDTRKSVIDIYPTSLQQFDVFLGRSENGKPRERYTGTRVIIPEGLLTFGLIKDDVALLRVDPFVVFTDNLMPICLDGSLLEVARLNPSRISIDQPFAPLPELKSEQKCTTDGRLPKRFHRCAGPCQSNSSPNKEDALCSRFWNELKADYTWDPDESPRTTFLVEQPGKVDQICFPREESTLSGWCRVKHSDSGLDYSRGQDWGFCSENCNEPHDRNPKDELLDIQDIAYCRKLRDFKDESEFCAGDLILPKIKRYRWIQNQGLEEIPISEEDYLPFLGGFATCQDFIGGGPAWQWTKISGEALQIRAIQVGVTSRTLGCCPAHNPTVFVKIGERREWILGQSHDGGCHSYA